VEVIKHSRFIPAVFLAVFLSSILLLSPPATVGLLFAQTGGLPGHPDCCHPQLHTGWLGGDLLTNFTDGRQAMGAIQVENQGLQGDGSTPGVVGKRGQCLRTVPNPHAICFYRIDEGNSKCRYGFHADVSNIATLNHGECVITWEREGSAGTPGAKWRLPPGGGMNSSKRLDLYAYFDCKGAWTYGGGRGARVWQDHIPFPEEPRPGPQRDSRSGGFRVRRVRAPVSVAGVSCRVRIRKCGWLCLLEVL
jgi:hypothetical protein